MFYLQFILDLLTWFKVNGVSEMFTLVFDMILLGVSFKLTFYGYRYPSDIVNKFPA